MAAADMPGGVSTFEQNPIPSPEFVDCSEKMTASGNDVVIGMDSKVRKSFDSTKVAIVFRGAWEGPQFTDDGIACGGVATYRGSLELRSGKYAERLEDGSYTLRTKAQQPDITGNWRKTSVDSEKMCDFVEKAKGRPVSRLGLWLREDRSYSDIDQPRITVSASRKLGVLTCDSAAESGGGVSPQGGNGSGGMSPEASSGGVSPK